MMTTYRNALRAAGRGTGALGVLLMCSASIAHAETAATVEGAEADQASTAAGANEIIVTAQRRSERLQDVPISISAVGAEELSKIGGSDITALRGAVPGLNISSTAGVNVSNLISIRGVGGLPSAIGASMATAIYLDGVFLSRPDAAFFSLDDVERIEVLRGPQGTLYGRNATAGAINIITREPGDTLEGGFDISTGNYKTIVARGSVSGPIAGGLSAGVSASYATHDGYYINTVTGNRIGEDRSYTVRGKLRWSNPDETFVMNLAGDTSRRNMEYVIPAQYAPGGIFVGIGNPKFVSFDALSEAQSQTITKGKGLALTIAYQPSDDIEITSITARRSIYTNIQYDTDGTALPAVFGGGDNRSKTFNQELRVVYSGDRFRATIGGNYYNEKASFGLSIFGPTVTPAYFNPLTSTEVDAWALFGQAEFDITDRLTLVGGLRYNHEDRDFVIDYTRAPINRGTASGSVSDSQLIPSAGVNFNMTPDALLYAKVSAGYQSPGYNGTAIPANTFDAEHLVAYEAGFKTQFFDRRVTFNGAAFYYDYKDLQVRTVIATGLTQIANAASASVKGIEATLDFQATDFLTLAAQATYLDAKYDSFCDGITGGTPQASDPLCGTNRADRAGNRLNLAPKWSGGVNATLHIPVNSAGELTARVAYSWESNSYFTAANEPIVATGGWNRLDARIAFPLAEDAEIYLYGRNLTDKRYINYAQRSSAVGLQGGRNDPRTYGIGLRMRF